MNRVRRIKNDPSSRRHRLHLIGIAWYQVGTGLLVRYREQNGQATASVDVVEFPPA